MLTRECCLVFVKQKTAYKLRISDLSSDVCSSDLAPSPENSFLQPSGLVGPGHLMSMLTRRHMHLYGTQPEALKEIVQATRANTRNRPKAVRRNGLSDEEYWGSPMLADPLRRLDFCLETDGAVARSEEHTSELQSLMRISYAVFCLKTKTIKIH